MRRQYALSGAAAAFVVLLTLCGFIDFTEAQSNDVISMSQGYRLPNNVQYLALAPNKVYPNQAFLTSITLLSMPFTSLQLRVTLTQDGSEYATALQSFTRIGTHQLTLKVPVWVTQGKHKMVVEGLVGTENAVFRNSSSLVFDTKYVSMFIQTDRPVYYSSWVPNNQDDWKGNYIWPRIDSVGFRIVATTPDLKPVSGPITVKIKDGQGNIVKRWLQRQLHFGIYEDSFKIAHPCQTGTWKITVEAFNHNYEEPFEVINWYPTRFEVNVSTPMYIFDTEWGIAGNVQARYLTGKDVVSNRTIITLTAKDKTGKFLPGELTQTMSYMDGKTQFGFALSEVEEVFGKLTTGHELHVAANVTDWYWVEDQIGWSTTRIVEDGVKLHVLGPTFRTFKPRVPFTVYIAVTRSDGTPYEGFLNRQIIVQAIFTGGGESQPERKLLVPDDSIVRYEVTPGEGTARIQIRARHISTGSGVDIDCYRYFSVNNRYLSVTISTDVPKVDEYAVFTVRTNFFAKEINYMIMAGGNVILNSQLVMSSQQKTFSIAVSRKMAPRARLLVYAVVDEEVLVDSVNFAVKDTRLTKCSLMLNKGKDFVGDRVELVGHGTPGAFLSSSGLNYEFYRRGAATFFNKEKIIRELVSYDEPNEGPYHYSWYYNDERWEETMFFTAPTSGVDHLTTFNISGLSALSDMNLTVTPESHNCNKTLGLGRCLSGECFELKYECDGVVQCTRDGYDELKCPSDRLAPRRPRNLNDIHYISPLFFPSEWLWHTTYVKARGRVEWQTDVPENFGSYVASAFVLDREEGLAISTTNVQHDARRIFYMVSEYPSHTRRGEQIGIGLTLFNNWHERIEVIVTLHGGDNYRFINVEEYGLVNAYQPRLSAGDVQTMVELRAGENKLIHMPVVPIIESGHLQIKVSAYSFLRIDTEIININLTYDGVTNDEHIPYLVDLVHQGSVIIPDFDIPIPERFFVPNQRDLLYIPGSNYVTVSVWGNVVAPGFFQPALHCLNTALVPPDSTDGMTFDIAINLQMLLYLQITSSLDRKASDRALDYMKFKLQTLYSNRQPDGSFKNFKRSTHSGVWVTAFVMQTLHEAQASEWNEVLYIEQQLINDAALWITKQQHPSGRFEETEDTFYLRAFWPNTTDELGNVHQDWHLPVTAYVTIALADANRLTGGAKSAVDTAKMLASDYLATKLGHITDPLQMAIVAYALQKANHKTAYDAFSALKRMQRETEFIYWADQEIKPNPTRVVNTVHFMQKRPKDINMGYANMATSYGLMLYLTHNKFDDSRPIMKWLNTQHNGMMSWSSTQDMLLVVKALTAYAIRETNREIYEMQLTLESTMNTQWKQVIHLNNTNYAELNQFQIPKAWGQIKASAKGTGYASIHVSAYVNVEKPDKVAGAPFDAIGYDLREIVFHGRNASKVSVTACLKWERPDIAPSAGQSWFEFEVPTGYTITPNTIQEIYDQNISGLRFATFRQQSYKQNALVISFSKMSQRSTCVNFRMDRWYPVANISIGHVVWTYEYAETGLQHQTMYETYTLFHHHICLVCGSYQCPYCPYYNAAPAVFGSHLGIVVMAIVTSLLVSGLWYPWEWSGDRNGRRGGGGR